MSNSNFEKLKTGKTNESREPGEAPKNQKSIPWGMIVVVLILFSILAGYIIYSSKLERTARWTIEDIAPRKSNQILEKGKKAPKTDTTKQKVLLEDKLVEEISPEDAGVAQTETTDSQSKDEDQLVQPSKTLDALTMPRQKIVINFDFNSNELNDEAYEKLDEIVRFVTRNPDSEIIIEGYTDARGDSAYNKRLSEFRANMVKNYLVAKGIDPSGIEAIGLGSQNFIASNDTEENRRLNRRVEIKVNIK